MQRSVIFQKAMDLNIRVHARGNEDLGTKNLFVIISAPYHTTTKCHAGASHPGVSSPRFLYRDENFTPVRNLAALSCKREATTRFGVKLVCRQTGTGSACVSSKEKLSFKITHSFDHLIQSNLSTNMLINCNNSSMRFEFKRVSLTILFGF